MEMKSLEAAEPALMTALEKDIVEAEAAPVHENVTTAQNGQVRESVATVQDDLVRENVATIPDDTADRRSRMTVKNGHESVLAVAPQVENLKRRASLTEGRSERAKFVLYRRNKSTRSAR